MKASYMLMGHPRADDGSTMDWRVLLAQLRAEGLQGVDVFSTYLAQAEVSVDECLAVLADNGLVAAQYAVQTDFISPDADIARSLRSIDHGIEVCVKHGIRQLFSFGGQHANSGPEAMSRYVEGLQQALERACAAGLLFSIENAGRMCHTWEELLECVERVGPDMRVTLDGGNFILAGSDAIVAAEKLGPRVIHVHVKNFRHAPEKQPRPFEYTRPAEGITDYNKLVGILADAGFDGYLSFEPEGWPHAPATDGVRFCAELAARYSRSG